MAIIDIIRADYANFPDNQSYQIYTEDVYFQDPMTRFRGIERYQKMVAFIKTWFKSPHLELHDLDRVDNLITTRWTLSWSTPLPWQPRITITGRSELIVNEADLIICHLDYWNCSRWDVFRQHFFSINN
jgi:Uncharacterized conserved protein (DUF2358)